MTTTIVVTSFYTPTPTAPCISPSSTSSTTAKKKFAALASGAAVGGFVLTCVIGWLLFQVWKRRHPHRWHGRSDAENFPGWRRVNAQKLFEAKEVDDESKTDDLSSSKLSSSKPMLSYPVTPNSPPKLTLAGLSSNQSDESASRTIGGGPMTTSPDLMKEYVAALNWSEERGEPIAPRDVLPHRAGSAMSHQSHHARPLSPQNIDFSGNIDFAGAEPSDLIAADRSDSSHSHHTLLTHYSYQSSNNPHKYHYQRSSTAMAAYSSFPAPQAPLNPNPNSPRTPSPTTYRRSSSQQSFYPSSAGGGGGAQRPGTSSSWHGHTMLTIPQGPPKSWNGVPFITPPQPALTLTTQPQAPPSSWNAGYFVSPPNTPTYWTPPPNAFTAPTPASPKFYFSPETNPPTPIMPPRPPTPPSPPLTPPRRLMCTNPDETRSLAASSRKSRPATPDPSSPTNSP